MNLSQIAYQAKDRLLDKIDQWIEANEGDGKVITQQNVIHARSHVRPVIENLNRKQAYEVERRIMEKEDYDPTKDKWGFGPVVICPLNYTAFVNDVETDNAD